MTSTHKGRGPRARGHAKRIGVFLLAAACSPAPAPKQQLDRGVALHKSSKVRDTEPASSSAASVPAPPPNASSAVSSAVLPERSAVPPWTEVAGSLSARVRSLNQALAPACVPSDAAFMSSQLDDPAIALRCFDRGDLDGDGQEDDVVLVQGPELQLGLVVLFSRGQPFTIGAGRVGTWLYEDESVRREPIAKDLNWLHQWQLKDATEQAGKPQTSARTHGSPRGRSAIYLSGGDAAGLVFRTSGEWHFRHLGF